jgi:hypothetical protein
VSALTRDHGFENMRTEQNTIVYDIIDNAYHLGELKCPVVAPLPNFGQTKHRTPVDLRIEVGTFMSHKQVYESDRWWLEGYNGTISCCLAVVRD